jgi:CheY-like chemotaxis protein
MTKLDPAPTSPGAGRLLVLVEDSPIQRRVLGDFLRDRGFEVEAVASAVEARQLLVHARPHAVVCDVVMPGMDGFALCRAIKDDPAVSAIPVVLITSTDIDESDERLASRAGAAALVPRTPGFGPLLESLRSSLDAPPEQHGPDAFLSELRARFLADGRADLPRVTAAVESREVGESLRRTLHRWAGRGSTLGFPAISGQARRLESALGASDAAAARDALARLDRLFRESRPAEARAERRATERTGEAGRGASPVVAASLADRRVALVGFTPAEAERMAEAFGAAGARAEPLAWRDGLPQSPTWASCDLAVLAAGGDAGRAPWLDPAALAGGDVPLLVVGGADDLAVIARALPGHQLLVAPWRPETLLLRAHLALQQTEDGAYDGAEPAGPAEVIVADDDPTILMLLEATLRNYGYRAHLVENGVEAIEVARRIRPRALIVDINMPGRDGYEVLSTLRAERATRGIPVLLLTARHQEADVIRAFDLGASEYMVKPFNPMELVARLRRLVAG